MNLATKKKRHLVAIQQLSIVLGAEDTVTRKQPPSRPSWSSQQTQPDDHRNGCGVLTVRSPCGEKVHGLQEHRQGNVTHSDSAGANEAPGKGINVPEEGLT